MRYGLVSILTKYWNIFTTKAMVNVKEFERHAELHHEKRT